MGYDVKRFKGHINDQFKCFLCLDVLKEPVQRPDCEHIFCRKCITSWLKKPENKTCPVDREPLTESDLKKAPRLLSLLMAELEISCKYKKDGCQRYLRLDVLEAHKKECPYNPDAVVTCDKGCEATLSRKDAVDHCCLVYLKLQNKENEALLKEIIEENNGVKEKLKVKEEIIKEYQKEMDRMRDDLERLRRETKVGSSGPGSIGGYSFATLPDLPNRYATGSMWPESESIWAPSALNGSPPSICNNHQVNNHQLNNHQVTNGRFNGLEAIETELGSMSLNGDSDNHHHQQQQQVEEDEETDSENGKDVKTVKITNLPEETSREDIENLFCKFGRILRIYVALDNYGAGSFSFVTFEQREDAAKAVNRAHGQPYHNLILEVEWAKKNFSFKDRRRFPSTNSDNAGDPFRGKGNRFQRAFRSETERWS